MMRGLRLYGGEIRRLARARERATKYQGAINMSDGRARLELPFLFVCMYVPLHMTRDLSEREREA